MRALDRMNRLQIITIVLLIAFCAISIQGIRAQAPGPVTAGFWFIRRPSVPEHIKQGAREALVLEINRLAMLATIPLGADDVTDYINNPIVWDQAQLDAVNIKIVELQALLDQY